MSMSGNDLAGSMTCGSDSNSTEQVGNARYAASARSALHACQPQATLGTNSKYSDSKP